jgi:predicted membrane protein
VFIFSFFFFFFFFFLKKKKKKKKKKQLFELANFERNYVSNLTTLKTRVIDELRGRSMFAQVHMDVLFSNIEDILDLHKEFLHHLVKQQKQNTVIDKLHGPVRRRWREEK